MAIEYIKEWPDVIEARYCEECRYGNYNDEDDNGYSGYACSAESKADCPIMEKYEIDADQLTNVKLEDVYREECPKFESAYLVSADYLMIPLNDEFITWINENRQDVISSMAWEQLL